MKALRKAIASLLGDKTEFNDEEINLFAQARLGQEVTRLGPILSEYLETKAQADRLNALQKLEKVDPTNAAAIASLQVEAKAAAKALTWLVNAVERGMIAEDQLRQRDEEDQDE